MGTCGRPAVSAANAEQMRELERPADCAPTSVRVSGTLDQEKCFAGPARLTHRPMLRIREVFLCASRVAAGR